MARVKPYIFLLVTIIIIVTISSVYGDRGEIIKKRYKSTTAKPELEQSLFDTENQKEEIPELPRFPLRRKKVTTTTTKPPEIPETSTKSPEEKPAGVNKVHVPHIKKDDIMPTLKLSGRRKKIKKRPENKLEPEQPQEAFFKPDMTPNMELLDFAVGKHPVPPLLAVEELKKIMMEVTPIQQDTELTDQFISLGDDVEVKQAASEPVTKKTVIVVEPKPVTTPVPEDLEEPENKERIVKEWMLFRTGVPLDYSYNETAETPGQIVSVPGCPKSVDGYPWVLFQSEGESQPKCYLVGQHSSVCQGSAVMNYRKNSDFGICACNFQECLVKRGLPLSPAQDDLNGNQLKRRNGLPGKLRYRFCKPLGVTCEEFVYDQKEKRCDIMYSQGNCRKGEWLQRNAKGGVECTKRLCEEGSGLSEKFELFQREFGNVTTDNAECCRPWGGFAVASVITQVGRSSCEVEQLWSETMRKCVTPFRSSSLMVG